MAGGGSDLNEWTAPEGGPAVADNSPAAVGPATPKSRGEGVSSSPPPEVFAVAATAVVRPALRKSPELAAKMPLEHATAEEKKEAAVASKKQKEKDELLDSASEAGSLLLKMHAKSPSCWADFIEEETTEAGGAIGGWFGPATELPGRTPDDHLAAGVLKAALPRRLRPLSRPYGPYLEIVPEKDALLTDLNEDRSQDIQREETREREETGKTMHATPTSVSDQGRQEDQLAAVAQPELEGMELMDWQKPTTPLGHRSAVHDYRSLPLDDDHACDPIVENWAPPIEVPIPFFCP